MDNMRIYSAVRAVPDNAIRKIQAGAYGAAGLSDINPQWRIEKMTEVFGPIGQGWIWEPVEQWADGGVHYGHVAVQYKLDSGEWSMPVHGYGGTKIGGRDDSDLLKSTFTDAVSNALRYIGVGANVWFNPNNDAGKNQFDSKYSAPPQTGKPKAQPKKEEPEARPQPADVTKPKIPMISAGQIQFIHSALTDIEIDALKQKYKLVSLKDMPRKTASVVIEKIQERRAGA